MCSLKVGDVSAITEHLLDYIEHVIMSKLEVIRL